MANLLVNISNQTDIGVTDVQLIFESYEKGKIIYVILIELNQVKAD